MLNLNKESVLLIEKEEKKLSSIFDKINELEMINSKKVLDAFHKNNLSESDLIGTTGYGYNDIGRVYQNPSMGTCPDMTILENMALADNKAKSYGLSLGINKKRIEYYKEQLSTLNLGLEDKLHIKVGVLSGGQRQAMALLMATMTDIKFLILDEHTAALDPKTADLIMKITDDVVREKHLTTVMVTHNLRYAVEYGSRLIMMNQGHIVMDKGGDEKANLNVDDILDVFNKISIECGN